MSFNDYDDGDDEDNVSCRKGWSLKLFTGG